MNPFIFNSERTEFVFTGYISYFPRTKFIFQLTFPKSSSWVGLENFWSVLVALMAELEKTLRRVLYFDGYSRLLPRPKRWDEESG